MSRKTTTINDFELGIMLRSKLTNFELQQEIMDSFHKHNGNMGEVMGDVLDTIQRLYMVKTELEFHLSPKGVVNGEINQGDARRIQEREENESEEGG